MASNTGMLGELFSPRLRDLQQEERDEGQRTQFLAQNPFTAMAHTAYSGASMAGKGLGRAAVAAAGGDPRSAGERNQAAVEAAKAQVAKLGIDPNDVDGFYKAVIDILRKQGLAAEALAVANEWHDQKSKRTDQTLKERDLTRKEAADAGKLSAANERNRIALLRLGTQGEPVVQLLGQLDKVPAEDTYRRKALLARIAELTKGSKVKVVDLGDRVQLVDELTGEEIREEQKGLAPKDEEKSGDKKQAAGQAYGEYLAGLQRQYNAAVDLYNHPGVEGITGKWGRWVGEEDQGGMLGHAASMLSGKSAGAALALYKQVTGGTFLAGLAKLKAASKTGATGLGAVSEREGDKVQSDAAALDRLQQAPDFRKQLATYISEIEGFASRMAAAAQTDGIPPQSLSTKPLTGPGRRAGGRRVSDPIVTKDAPSAPQAAATGGLSPDKQKRLQELRAKRANGTIKP